MVTNNCKKFFFMFIADLEIFLELLFKNGQQLLFNSHLLGMIWLTLKISLVILLTVCYTIL